MIINLSGKNVVIKPLVPEDEFMKAVNSTIFTRWVDSLHHNFNLKSITVHNVFMFGNRVGFIIAEADVTHNGKKVPGITFLRGDSVSIMPVITCGDKTYTVTVTEPRVPIAYNRQCGLPCGMVDGDTVNVAALKELQEEVGPEFNITSSDLVNMGRFPLSSGGCDEYMDLTFFRKEVTEDVLDAINGRMNISEKESEQILVKVIEIDDLINIENVDARTLLSYHLWKSNYGQ